MTRRLRRLDLGPPASVFLVSTVALGIAATAAGHSIFRSATWIHSDAGHYLAIAADGYQLFHCVAPYAPGDWCGNSGWFPAYPALVAMIGSLGLSLSAVAVAVSWCFSFATLVLLWEEFLRPRADTAARLALAFAAFVPGGVYARAAFPMSMTAFFLLLGLALLRRGKLGGAALAGFAAAMSYPTGVLMAVVVALWALLEHDRPVRERVGRAAGAAAVVVMGTVTVCAALRAQTGRWDAYFLTQAKYDHGLHLPFAELWSYVHDVLRGVGGAAGVSAIQESFVAVVVLVLAAATGRRAVRGVADRFELVTGATVAAYWLVPLTQANVSHWRGDMLLVVAALLIARLPRALAEVVVAVSVALFVALAFFFFQGTLV